MKRGAPKSCLETREEHTIYGNSNTFGQLITICADEARDAPKLVDFEIVIRERSLSGIGYDLLQVQFVRFGNSLNRDRSRMVLLYNELPFSIQNTIIRLTSRV